MPKINRSNKNKILTCYVSDSCSMVYLRLPDLKIDGREFKILACYTTAQNKHICCLNKYFQDTKVPVGTRLHKTVERIVATGPLYVYPS